jgi:polygalacturonase
MRVNKRAKEALVRRGGIEPVLRKILPVLICFILLAGSASEAIAGWEQVDEILGRIKAPQFPNRDFNITDYGAVGDGQTDCTEAFRKAISAAQKAGGGRVVVPAGVYLTGAIHLKSSINLYVADGAVIKFSTDPNKYLPAVLTRFEGIECINYSPNVYAYDQENIAVTGTGTLDGQASELNWWKWNVDGSDINDIEKLNDYGRDGMPVEKRVFGAGHYLRPNMIQPYRCKNVLIEGVTIKNSPMWHVHFVLSQNITVRNVKIIGHGPNNDGCNPDSCKDVLIESCYFDNGDDCVTIKSGRNNDGRRVNVPCENIVVRNCQMKDGYGGIVLGSEMSGGVRNVFTENCKMDSPNLRQALRIKSNAVRGGFIENIYMRNIKIGEVNEAIFNINFLYGEAGNGPYLPTVRNINFENVTSQKSKYVLFLVGFENKPSITDISLKDCAFNNVQNADVLSGVKKIILENVKCNYASVN